MDWVRGSVVGRGSSGAVHLAFRRSNPSATFVVKSAPLSSASLLQREEAILIDLQNCPQIISCFGHDVTDGDQIYNLFLEYADGGSISDAIRRAGGALSEPAIRRYLRSILLGLRQIHAMEYVHCDIKPQNILIVGGEVKIADFGLAKKVGEESAIEIRGTPMYMAPESVASKEYNAAADIWAFGCTVVEMVSGHPPWRSVEESENGLWALLMRIGSTDELPEIPPVMSEAGKDFLECCFVKDPNNRWTAEMLLSHPFLTFSPETEQKKNAFCSFPHITPTSVLGYSFCQERSTFSELERSNTFLSKLEEDLARERIREIASEERPEWANCSSEDDGWISVRENNNGGKVEYEEYDIPMAISSCIGGTVELDSHSLPLLSLSCSLSEENRRVINFDGGTRIGFFACLKKICKKIMLRIWSGFLNFVNSF